MGMIYGARTPAWRAAAACVVAVLLFGLTTPGASAQTLTLGRALSLAAERDLGLPAGDARTAAAAAAVRQAGVKPNPVVGVDVENFAATGAHGLVDQVEATFYYEQQLERGEKRIARVSAANVEIDIARLRRNIRALDLFRQVQLAWTEAVAASSSVRIARDQLGVAQALRDDVNRRVQAARDPLFAGQRAEMQVSQAEIALAQAEIAAENTNAALGAYLGVGTFSVDPAALGDLTAPLAATPALTTDLALLERERDAATARIRVEQVRARPDATVRGGLRSFGIGDEVALVVGGSMPLGTNDTNRGNIERAEAERVAVEREIAAARVQRDREVVRLRARLQANITEVRRLDAEILPRAEETLRLVRDGYRQGGFSYIDIIDAQRAVIETQSHRIAILKSFHTERAALDRLTDRYADLIPPATESLP